MGLLLVGARARKSLRHGSVSKVPVRVPKRRHHPRDGYWKDPVSCSTGIARDSGCWPRDTKYTAQNESKFTLLYPYHPLHGKEFEIFDSAGGLRDLV